MKILFLLTLLLNIFLFNVFACEEKEDSIENIAIKLQEAIVNRDESYIQSLDKNGDLFVLGNIAYLFDSEAMKKYDPSKKSVQEILKSEKLASRIESLVFNGHQFFIIYWFVGSPVEDIELSHEDWLKSIAACALEQSNGKWYFYNHLCFAETEGPF